MSAERKVRAITPGEHVGTWNVFYADGGSTLGTPVWTRCNAAMAEQAEAMTTPRIYVASLSDYNAGVLHGTWIDADQDAESIHAEIATMLAESPSARREGQPAEEWAIHDHEGFYGLSISEYEDIDKVSELGQAIAEHGEAFAVYVANEGADYATVEGFEEAYEGEFESAEDWAREYVDSCGLLETMPENMRNYFDYEAFASDAEMGGDMTFIDCSTGGVFAFHNV